MSKSITHNRGTSEKSSLSKESVENFSIFSLPLFIYLLSLLLYKAVIPCLTASTNDNDAKSQSNKSEYIAFGKGDLQLQATNLAEGQNAQPVLSGKSPDQSILQNGKGYFVAQFSHIFISWELRGVWTNMLVNTANREGAERDWYA